MLNNLNSYYVKILFVFFVSLTNKSTIMYRKKIKTPFGYAPVSLNFDCFLIYCTSCWLLSQLSRFELERIHNVSIETQSFNAYVASLCRDMYYLTVYGYPKNFNNGKI